MSGAHVEPALGPPWMNNTGGPSPMIWTRTAVPLVVNAFAVVAEKVEVQCKGAVRLQLHDLAHLGQEIGLAVGRQSHDLVFVAVIGKAQVLREGLVEDTERVGK